MLAHSIRKLLADIDDNSLSLATLSKAAVTVGRLNDTLAVMLTLGKLLDHESANVRRAALMGIDAHIQFYSPKPSLRVLNRVLKMASYDPDLGVRTVAENVVFLIKTLYTA